MKSLGRIGDLETEIDSILVENSIEVTPFSLGILKELPTNEEAAVWEPDAQEDLITHHITTCPIVLLGLFSIPLSNYSI